MTLGDRQYKWMVTYSVVDSEECGKKFKCDGCDKICERSNSLRLLNYGKKQVIVEQVPDEDKM